MEAVRPVRPAELFRRRDEVEILDVREPAEWAAGHIDGARHVPMGQVPAVVAELPQDRTIVAVCRSGNRSGQVAEFLHTRGFEAHNLDGGLLQWARAGFPLTGAEDPRRRH